MTGNEFGERIHDFFGQEGLSQDQHRSQVADRSWSSFSNRTVGNHRQIDPSLIANLKNYSTQQSVDPERGQSSISQHGLNFTQQPVRTEYSRSQLQDHQQTTNGHTHGNLVLYAMPSEANFLGVNAESTGGRLTTKGFPSDHHKIPMRLEMGESPVNYDFFGGQQQINSQFPGMLQSLPRPQMTFNDMQLLKQQNTLKQMHEYQMQQQIQKQQLEGRQLISLNQNAVNGSHPSNNQSQALINGISLQDASSNSWQRDPMTGNTNWMPRDIPSVAHASSSGLMITPEHGQVNLMGSFSQQFEPSLYGVPVSATKVPQNAYSSIQMNSLAEQHVSTNRTSSMANQSTAFLNQGDVQDSRMLPRSGYQEKLLFSHKSVPGSNNKPSVESFQQDDSEKSYMKVAENITASQKSTTLDPTEEKILFGSDDNLWDAFGKSTDMSLAGNLLSTSLDLFDACPSLQSGSWSALMQSAVAETSSDDAAVHECGSKQQSVWADSNISPQGSFHIESNAQDSNALRETVHCDAPQAAGQCMQGSGSKVSDHSLLGRSFDQRSQMAGNMFHSLNSGSNGRNNLCSIQENEGIEDRLGVWKAASNSNLTSPMEQKNRFTQNLQSQRASYGFGTTGAGNDSTAARGVHGNIQQYLDNNSLEKAISQQKSRDGSQFSRNALQPLKSLNLLHTDSDRGETSQSTFAPWASNQSFTQQGKMFPGIPEETNITSGFPFSRGYHQNQLMPVANGQSTGKLSVISSSELSTSPMEKRDEYSDIDHLGHSAQTPSMLNPTTHKGDAADGFPMQEAMSVSQPLDASSLSQQAPSGMISDLRPGISPHQHQFWNQPSKAHPDILRSHLLPTNLEGSFSRQEKGNQITRNGGDVSLSGRDMMNMHELQSQDNGAKQTSDVSSMFSKIAQNNLQTFGRSLTPNNLPEANLGHNELMAGNGENESPKMTVTGVEGSAVDPQKVASKGEQQSPSRTDVLVRDGLNHKESANHMLHFGQTVPQKFSNKDDAALGGAERQQISPQMAPSWYSQYGTFKNGQAVPVIDTGRFTPLKREEQSSTVGSLVDSPHSIQSSKQLITVDPDHVVHTHQISGAALRAEIPLSESLPHSSTSQLLIVDKPKKRKTTTSVFLSWHKEITQGPQRFQSLGEIEGDWARATNRLAEKLELGALFEDRTPIRSKRRLIYTPQLMQQLFRPPPAKFISLVAISNYECIAYATARVALGDACSFTSTDRSESFCPSNNSIPLSKRTTTEKISDQYISKAAEDFISRTRKLEIDFAGLEKGITIQDLRVEVEDLEKFGVINRFAKFHPSSLSTDRTVSSLRLYPQRYVSIAPMPQNVPDRVQCLSL